jgi:hypothetical protein
MDLLCVRHGEFLRETALARPDDRWMAGCAPQMAALFLRAARVFHLKWLPEHRPTNHRAALSREHGVEAIGAGAHERMVIDTARFIERLLKLDRK